MSALGGKADMPFAPALLLMGKEIGKWIPSQADLFRDHVNVGRCAFLFLGKEIGKWIPNLAGVAHLSSPAGLSELVSLASRAAVENDAFNVNLIAFVWPRSVTRHKKTHLQGIVVIAVPLGKRYVSESANVPRRLAFATTCMSEPRPN